MPDKILNRPQRRLQAFEELRLELIKETGDINKKIKDICMKIKANIYNEASDEGLLELDFAEYEDCFFVDVQQVRDLLEQEHSRLR